MASEFVPVKGRGNGWGYFFVAVMAATLLLLIWIMVMTTWGKASLSYALTEQSLQITRGPNLIEIDRAAIQRAEAIRVTKGKRTFGTGAPGYCAGRWTFAETGRITLYATCQQPLVVLETAEGKYGINPIDPEGFLQALRAGQTGTWAPQRPGNTFWGNSILTALLGIALLVIAGTSVLIFKLTRWPEVLRYQLEADALVIATGWSKVRVPYSSITGVQIATPKGWPLRVWGSNLPGAYWGRFSWRAAGPNLKLFTTRMKPLVLISAGKTTYGVTPAEDERFTAELTQRLAK